MIRPGDINNVSTCHFKQPCLLWQTDGIHYSQHDALNPPDSQDAWHHRTHQKVRTHGTTEPIRQGGHMTPFTYQTGRAHDTIHIPDREDTWHHWTHQTGRTYCTIDPPDREDILYHSPTRQGGHLTLFTYQTGRTYCIINPLDREETWHHRTHQAGRTYCTIHPLGREDTWHHSHTRQGGHTVPLTHQTGRTHDTIHIPDREDTWHHSHTRQGGHTVSLTHQAGRKPGTTEPTRQSGHMAPQNPPDREDILYHSPTRQGGHAADPFAQLVEHETGNLKFAGSSPAVCIDKHESLVYLVVKRVPDRWIRMTSFAHIVAVGLVMFPREYTYRSNLRWKHVSNFYLHLPDREDAPDFLITNYPPPSPGTEIVPAWLALYFAPWSLCDYQQININETIHATLCKMQEHSNSSQWKMNYYVTIDFLKGLCGEWPTLKEGHQVQHQPCILIMKAKADNFCCCHGNHYNWLHIKLFQC